MAGILRDVTKIYKLKKDSGHGLGLYIIYIWT